MSDLAPCEHQVGGWHNGTQSCVLKAVKEGVVLKPLKLNANPTYDPTFDPNTFFPNQYGAAQHTSNAHCTGQQYDQEVLIPVCRDELEFYQHLQTSTQPDDMALKPFVPEFHGCREVTTQDGSVTPHLVLEDLARGMQWPCVLDVKIGRTFAYPGKDHTKKGKKYATQEQLGYCLTGLRVFHPHTGKVLTELRPDACKHLITSQVFQSLDTFCQVGETASSDLRHAIASHLRQIYHWFLVQRTYKIRCGSILVVYDAAVLAPHHTTKSSSVNTINASSANTPKTSSVNTCSKYQASENTTLKSQASENISAKTQSSVNAAAKSQTLENISAQPSENKAVKPQTLENISRVTQSLANISTEAQSSANTAVIPQTSENISTETRTSVSISNKSLGSSGTPTEFPASSSTSKETQNSEHNSSLYKIPTDTSTESQVNQLLSLVQVKMIDFAHVLYSFGDKDENYIFGLENLISFFSGPGRESL